MTKTLSLRVWPKAMAILGVLWAVSVTLVALSPRIALAEADKKTERLFKSKCASCHGPDGKGDTDQGKEMGASDMSTAAWQKNFTDDQVKTAISDGFKREKNGKQQEMKAMKDSLKPDQIDALVKYVRSLAK